MGGWAEFLQDMNNYYGVEMDCLSREFREEQQVRQNMVVQQPFVTSSLQYCVRQAAGGRSMSTDASGPELCHGWGVMNLGKSTGRSQRAAQHSQNHWKPAQYADLLNLAQSKQHAACRGNASLCLHRHLLLLCQQ